MKVMKKIIPLFVALCMMMSLMPQSVVFAEGTDYLDAYSVISSSNYAAYNEEFYTNGIVFTSNGDDGFVCDKNAWVGYNVDFGEKSANTLIMNMRPDVRNGHGQFGVYVDSIDSEPIVVFDESVNVPYAGYTTYAGPGYGNYCFNLAEPLTGQHTVYFKGISNELATTFFDSFCFSDSTTDAYTNRISPYSGMYSWGSYSAVKDEADGDETLSVLPLNRGVTYITGIDFGNDTEKGGVGVKVRYNRWNTTSYYGEGSYEVRLDSIDGPVIGELENSSVNTGFNTYDIQFNTLLTGVHTLVFAVPFNTTIGWMQFTEGTSEDIIVSDDSAPSAYEKYDVNLSSAFADASTKYSFDVDFGTSVPEYLVFSMRPALENAADGGVINVYLDDETTDPIASFTTYRDEVNHTSGNTVPTEWFAPISVPEGFGGEHKVIFKSQSNAKSAFNYFRFDKDVAARDAYKSVLASTYNYTVHSGNTMWGGGGTGDPQPFVVGFGAEGKKYFSAAYTKVDFGDMASDTLIVRLNKLSSNEGSVQVRLGSRYGEVIGTLSSGDITLGTGYSNAVEFYTISLNKTLTGVQDIVFTSDIDTTFYSFYFTAKEKPVEATDENTTYAFDDTLVTSADGGDHSARTDGTYTGTHTKTADKTYQIKLENVDFGKTKSTYALNLIARTLSKDDETNVLKFYIDSTDTTPIGEFYAKDGITASNICEYPVEISNGVSGIHDVYVEWTGQWILHNFTCIKGTADVFGTDNNGVIYAVTSQIRSSTDQTIQSNGALDSGYTVSGIGKGGLVNSVSFAGLDFGTDGVEKLTLRMTRVGDAAGTVKVLLGDRNGIELVSKPLSEVTGGGVFQSYEFPISREIIGIHMITVTIDYESILNYVAFNLDGEPVVIDPSTVKNGNEPVSVLDCTAIEGGTFTSSNSGGGISVYAPVYTSGMAEGGSITFNLNIENPAKYVAICAKSNNTQAASVVSINKGDSELAAITIPQAYRNGMGYYMDVYTAELSSAVSGTASYNVTMKSNTANVSWIQFMTEEQYNAFQNNRTKVALLGDSNVEYGKYTVALREMLDVNKYNVKSLGVSGRTVRNYGELPEYQTALEYAPDIVVFTLGTNDSAQSCNDDYMTAFKTDYIELINGLKGANPDVKIYLQYPLPLQYDEMSNPDWSHNTENLKKIISAIDEVAAAQGVEVIDIYNGLLNYGYDRELLYTDELHVNEAGGTVMAKLTKSAIAPCNVEITPANGDAAAVSAEVDTTILTQKGATAKASSEADVYWLVENLDGTDSDKATITADGIITAVKPGTYKVTAVSKANTSVKTSVQMENRFTYVISTDADIISPKDYAFRALKNFRQPFVAGYADGTVVMLKDVMLDEVSAFVVRASSLYDTSANPLKVECRLDSVNGNVIGSTIITKNSKDAKYAFMPYKNAIDPVCDGQPHNLFFVLNRGTDTSGTTRTIDGIYGIEFEYGMAQNIAVFEDGVLQDTIPIVNASYDTTEKFTGYKAGKTYTWKTTSAGNADGELIMAVYDADGVLKSIDIADKADGVLTASLTLPDSFDASYTIKSIALENMAGMKPVLGNTAVQTSDKITIGCIGDSITNNWNSDELGYQEYCYPKFLQSMLGSEKYEVMNFGRGTSTASSYVSNPWFERAKEAQCDVYIIMLGTNDSKSSQYYEAISTDYQAIIDGLKEANPNCKIYINLPVAAHGDNFGINDSVIEDEVIPRIEAIAESNGIEPLDLHTLTEEHPNFDAMYFSDNIHPNEFGQSFIAECVKNAYFAD